MSTQHTISHCKIDFPTSPSWFRTIRQLVMTASKQCGFTDREAGQISMAVDEALSNIYRHGYKGAHNGRVRLTFETTVEPETHIAIEIEDDAEQVDTDLIQSRDLENIKPGGLGVHLIQSVMCKATWIKRSEGGMNLSMSKTAMETKTPTLATRTKTNG